MTSGQRPKALFVTYGGGHISMVLPVILALERSHPEVDCVLLALTTGHLKARAVRPTLGYRNFLHLVDAGAAKFWGEELSRHNMSPDVPPDETVAYLGINYLDLIATHGEIGAAELYRERGRYGFLPLAFMRRLLEDVAPDVVIATNSPRSEHAALEAARSLAIPCVGLVDLFGLDSDSYVIRSTRPDWTCVISDAVKHRLVAHGFEASRVVATGNPAFDGLFSPENKRLAAEFMERQGWHGLSPILWAGHKEFVGGGLTTMHTGHEFALEAEAALREFVQVRKGSALVVRYHPSEWHTFPRLGSQARVHFSVPSLESIHPLILAAKAVVIQNSTVGLEAAVAGVPAISLEYAPSIRGSFSLAEMGVSTPCHSAGELPGILDGLLATKARVPTDYASDAKAAERVALVIARAMGTVVS